MDLTPGPGEDQKRDDDPEGTYVYVNGDLDVARTVEISGSINVDVDVAGRVHGIELIGAMQWWDMYQQVLRVLPQNIHEAAYRAGREDAALCDKQDHSMCGDKCCQICAALNIVWFTDSETWNRVRPQGGVLCVRCFVLAAEELGIGTRGGWRLVPEFPEVKQPRTPLGAETTDTESSPETDEQLHARFAHPAWEYKITEGQRKAWDHVQCPDEPADSEGWVRNVHAGRKGWDRFDYTEECYWMRPRVTGTESSPEVERP